MLTTHLRTRTKPESAFLLLIIALFLLCFSTHRVFAQCGPMDVAFVLDDTASMGGALNSFNSELADILDTIEKSSRGDYRLSLVTFKDNVTVREIFTPGNRASIAQKISQLRPEGGKNLPEASDEAMNTVINALPATGRQQVGNFSEPFRSSAFKLIILLTDAAPGGFADSFIPGTTDVRAHDYAVQAANKGVKISAIYVPTYADDTPLIRPIMQDYANTTSGFYLETAQDGSNTAESIKRIIVGCGSTGTVPTLINITPSDDKAGSILFFNYYTSDITNPALENTLITLTNTDETSNAILHLFFVDGDTGSVMDTFQCILPTRHVNLFASEFDPGVKGYMIAVAVDQNGCPVNFNKLIGSTMIKTKTGHQAYLNAISFSALSAEPAICDTDLQIATMKFDGLAYDLAPRVLAIENVPSSLDGNQGLLIVNKFGGDLTKFHGDTPTVDGIGVLNLLNAVIFSDTGKAYNGSMSGGTPQHRNIVRDGYPRVFPRLSNIIGTGKSGWIRFSTNDSQPMLGAMIQYNPNAIQNSGNNLHQLAYTDSATLTIPIQTPVLSCQ